MLVELIYVHQLTIEEILLLLYYRTYVNHIFIGMIGGVDDSNVGRNFKKIDYLLAKILDVEKLKRNKEERLNIYLIQYQEIYMIKNYLI